MFSHSGRPDRRAKRRLFVLFDGQPCNGASAQGGDLIQQTLRVHEDVRRARFTGHERLSILIEIVREAVCGQMHFDPHLPVLDKGAHTADAFDIGLDLGRPVDGVQPQTADGDRAVGVFPILDVIEVRGGSPSMARRFDYGEGVAATLGISMNEAPK